MNREAELERIRLFSIAARQRIHRLDVLLDEQVRVLDPDQPLNGEMFRKWTKGRLITRIELQVFSVVFLVASASAFLTGFWVARFR